MGDGSIKLSAALAESKTINGISRHIHIKALGGINEAYLNICFKQAQFWKTAEARLDTLSISKKDRVRVTKSLRARVPRPTEKQLKREAVALEEYSRRCVFVYKKC